MKKGLFSPLNNPNSDYMDSRWGHTRIEGRKVTVYSSMKYSDYTQNIWAYFLVAYALVNSTLLDGLRKNGYCMGNHEH